MVVDTKQQALTNAMSLLTRREHSAHELITKLTQKGHSEEATQHALVTCQRLELQSDTRFVESRCRLRIRQGYGPVRIRNELQQAHIESFLIDEALQKEQEHWVDYARAVWAKKYKQGTEATYAAVQKQKQFLLYRGFTMDTIAMVFSND